MLCQGRRIEVRRGVLRCSSRKLRSSSLVELVAVDEDSELQFRAQTENILCHHSVGYLAFPRRAGQHALALVAGRRWCRQVATKHVPKSGSLRRWLCL